MIGHLAEKKTMEWGQVYNLRGATYDLPAIVPMTPYQGYVTMAQGPASNQRIGNKVRPHRCILKGIVWPAPYDSLSNPTPEPFYFRIWLFRLKPQQGVTIEAARAVVDGSFFQYQGANLGIFGTLNDMNYAYNTEAVSVVATKTFKIGFSVYNGTSSASNVAAAAQSYANNDFKLNRMFRWNITKYLPKVYTWDDGVQAGAFTGRPLFMFFEPLWATNLAIPAGNIIGFFDLRMQLKYTDV